MSLREDGQGFEHVGLNVFGIGDDSYFVVTLHIQ